MRLVNIKRLSKYLDVPAKTIRHWVHLGSIPYIKPVGKYLRDKSTVLFDLDKIDKMLKTREYIPPKKKLDL